MNGVDGGLLLAVDGNSLLHRAFHAYGEDRALAGETPLLDPQGRPLWAIKGMLTYLARAAARLRPDAVLVGFDHLTRSARKDDFSGYKAHRPAKHLDLVDQLERVPEVLAAAGLPVVVPEQDEADDVLCSAAALARSAGWRCVAMTSDRDAFALIDERTSVLRVRNGGLDESPLVTVAGLAELYGITPAQYRDFAALRGDASDNLPGVSGIGAKTAARLLVAFGSAAGAFAALDGGAAHLVVEAVGERPAEQLGTAQARERVERNRRLMAMRSDLPLPALERLRLPVDPLRMRAAMIEYGIQLGPSLWALTGGRPPEELPTPVSLPKARRGLTRTPGPGQLALF